MGYLIIKKNKCISVNINSVNDLSIPEEDNFLCMEPLISVNIVWANGNNSKVIFEEHPNGSLIMENFK